jgi:hypothetical protein
VKAGHTYCLCGESCICKRNMRTDQYVTSSFLIVWPYFLQQFALQALIRACSVPICLFSRHKEPRATVAVLAPAVLTSTAAKTVFPIEQVLSTTLRIPYIPATITQSQYTVILRNALGQTKGSRYPAAHHQQERPPSDLEAGQTCGLPIRPRPVSMGRLPRHHRSKISRRRA